MMMMNKTFKAHSEIDLETAEHKIQEGEVFRDLEFIKQ